MVLGSILFTCVGGGGKGVISAVKNRDRNRTKGGFAQHLSVVTPRDSINRYSHLHGIYQVCLLICHGV